MNFTYRKHITFISKIFWNSEDCKSGKRILHCFTKSLGDSIGDITIFNIISAFAIPFTTTCMINNILNTNKFNIVYFLKYSITFVYVTGAFL